MLCPIKHHHGEKEDCDLGVTVVLIRHFLIVLAFPTLGCLGDDNFFSHPVNIQYHFCDVGYHLLESISCPRPTVSTCGRPEAMVAHVLVAHKEPQVCCHMWKCAHMWKYQNVMLRTIKPLEFISMCQQAICLYLGPRSLFIPSYLIFLSYPSLIYFKKIKPHFLTDIVRTK